MSETEPRKPADAGQAVCDRDRLRRLLQEEPAGEVAQATIEHLSRCAACRQELEDLAGNSDWWSEVAISLKEQPEGLSDSSEATALPADPTWEQSFAAEFAVDFLEPATGADALGRLGDIEVLEVIARGGMGVVLKGFQRELGRYVAVKVMAPHLALHGSARERFAREARAAAAIVHPHVMAIHSVNSTARLPYLVMPYLACESLQQRIDRNGPLDLRAILRIGMQTASGLAAAHARGLIHRDVKPANILLERSVDRVLLTDFGLARAVDDASLTRSGVIAGTPQYMSPEQARGERLDQRSDLFSLGGVLYAMCAGRPPFRAETSYGILRRITDNDPRPLAEINPDTPGWLSGIIDRLLAKGPEQRFASANEVADLLEKWLAHVEQPSVVPRPESGKKAAFRQFSWKTVALGVAAPFVVAGLLLSRPQSGQENQPPKPDSAPIDDAGSIAEAREPGSDFAVWDDGVDLEIDALAEDVDRLAKDSETLWDQSVRPSRQETLP